MSDMISLTFEKVDELWYLGTMMSIKNNWSKKIRGSQMLEELCLP